MPNETETMGWRVGLGVGGNVGTGVGGNVGGNVGIGVVVVGGGVSSVGFCDGVCVG